eukprot:TRINITY_DN31092_c0_g1_i1.p1 TRINITY_DN31092_c0_g1~~TRINITY_DN31092_c0_g1_i1.p1  ORF type:complete len:381 (-),score=56.10 TRINITY_DN31092_c0_g1_i1:139-1281(-)
MALVVTLASGQVLEVSTTPGSPVADLRSEVGRQLGAEPACLELFSGETVLEDSDVVPEGSVGVFRCHFPWIDDSTERVVDLGGGALSFGGEEKKGDSKFNALCDVPFTSGTAYFEVEVLSGDGAWVGVTTKAGFGPGYKLKGLMFGGPGNLSNGSGGLVTGFADQVKTGDIIGVDLDLSNQDTVDVTFWQSGKCLGKAFAACPRPSGAAVFPVVSGKSVGDSFRLSLRKKTPVFNPPPQHGAVGKWQLQRLQLGGDDVDVAAAYGGRGGMLKMQVKASTGNTFTLSMRVCNAMNTTATVTSSSDGETIVIAPPMSTMMMGPPALMDLEQRIGAALPSATSWSVRDAGSDNASVQLTGPNFIMQFIVDTDPGGAPCTVELR